MVVICCVFVAVCIILHFLVPNVFLLCLLGNNLWSAVAGRNRVIITNTRSTVC